MRRDPNVPRESKASLKKRSGKILAVLRRTYPDAKCALNYRDPLQLLVATILSAQCTDERVNLVTKNLFRKYKTAEDYAAAGQEEFEQAIRTAGFFRNKTKSVRSAAARIVESFGGKVPDTMDELLTLSGVARKTANVVLGNAFGKNEGIVVDTHVKRLAARLRLSKQNVPDKIEQDLMALIPRADWTLWGHLLIWHGRSLCTARKANCGACPLQKLCPSAFRV